MSEIKQIQNEDFRKPLLLLKKGDKIKTKSGKIYTQKFSFEQRARQIKKLTNVTEEDISDLTDALERLNLKEVVVSKPKMSKSDKEGLRTELARRMKVPASSLKKKTFQELKDLYTIVITGDIEGAKALKDIQETLNLVPDPNKGFDFEDFEDKQDEYAGLVTQQSVLSNLEKLGITLKEFNKMTEKEKMDLYQKVGIVFTTGIPSSKLEESMKSMKGKIVETTGDIERTEEPTFDFSLTRKKPKMPKRAPPSRPEEPVEQKYETEKMDDDDRFSDNFFRGVNSYGSFIPNPLVPERQRYRDFSIKEDIEEQNRTMRNDPDVLVQPPQNILEQNRILEGPDDVMPESEVEPQNPARVNYEMAVASNNMHSMEQNIQDRNAQRVRIAQRRILGEEVGDDEFGEDLEVEMKEEQEEKYDPNLLVRDNETREQSFLNNKARLDAQIEELSLASQSRRNQTRGKEAHYQREAMSRLKAQDKMNQMNIDALRAKEIKWKRPTRTQAGNSVGLVRQSNRSMALLAHQLLP